MREQMTIGLVARKSGFPVRTLRFYEERGLILPLGRTAKGYRLYGPEALGDLAFLKAGKRPGLALDQIGELLRIRSSGRCPCSRTRELLEGRLAEVEGALQELGELRDDLHRVLWQPNGEAVGPATLPCRTGPSTAAGRWSHQA